MKLGFSEPPPPPPVSPPVTVMAPGLPVNSKMSPSLLEISTIVGVPEKAKVPLPTDFAVRHTSKSELPLAKVTPLKDSSYQDSVILPGVVPLPGIPKKDSVNPDNPKFLTALKSNSAAL